MSGAFGDSLGVYHCVFSRIIHQFDLSKKRSTITALLIPETKLQKHQHKRKQLVIELKIYSHLDKKKCCNWRKRIDERNKNKAQQSTWTKLFEVYKTEVVMVLEERPQDVKFQTC